MTTTTKKNPIVHCEDGVLTMEEIVAILNSSVGNPEDLSGVSLETRVMAEKYAREYFKTFEDVVMDRTVYEEKEAMWDQLNGFIDGFQTAKTGKIVL
jgi:hypothetical protein